MFIVVCNPVVTQLLAMAKRVLLLLLCMLCYAHDGQLWRFWHISMSVSHVRLD